MRIDNTRPSGGIQNGKERIKSKTGGASFSISEDSKLAGASSSAPVGNVANLDALLALQNVTDDDGTSQRRASERGFDLLDRLEEMRLQLLSGKLSKAQVDRIAYKTKGMELTGDEKLDSILSDIDLRARVELAKLGIYDF